MKTETIFLILFLFFLGWILNNCNITQCIKVEPFFSGNEPANIIYDENLALMNHQGGPHAFRPRRTEVGQVFEGAISDQSRYIGGIERRNELPLIEGLIDSNSIREEISGKNPYPHSIWTRMPENIGGCEKGETYENCKKKLDKMGCDCGNECRGKICKDFSRGSQGGTGECCSAYPVCKKTSISLKPGEKAYGRCTEPDDWSEINKACDMVCGGDENAAFKSSLKKQ